MKTFISIFVCISLVLACTSKNNLVIPQKDMSKSIAFIKDNDQIGIIDLDGKIINKIDIHGSENFSPTWSPDGKKLAFIQSRNDEVYLDIYDLSSGHHLDLCELSLKHLDYDNIPSIKWSKNIKTIYFMDASGLNSINLNGKKNTISSLTDIKNFDISYDENKLAYSDSSNIYLAEFKDGIIDTTSIINLQFERASRDKIKKISFSNTSRKLGVISGKKLVIIDLISLEPNTIAEASDPMQWFSWDSSDSVVYYLSGLSTQHKQMA